MEKVVLAFSGGLDTSYCVKYLADDCYLEVHSVLVDTGGFTSEELKEIEQRAYDLGVKSHTIVYETPNFYEKCIKYLIAGNILKNNTYPLSVSAERVFQAIAIAKQAKKLDAKYVAHGSTGAGNDQVRFDMIFNILAPEMEILTPIRDKSLARQEEIDYLISKGVEANWEKAVYSINKGIWGTSIGGKETLTSSDYLPDEAFISQPVKDSAEELTIGFKQGNPVRVNGERFDSPVDAIKAVAKIGSQFAIGRDIHVGDTIIGIKGRVGFEAPAPILIIKAHHALEKHVLTKQQLMLKDNLGAVYGDLVHEGKFLDPVARDLEAFFASTQKYVNGEVKIQLAPYRFHIIGIQSEHDLMSSKFGSYGEENKGWSAEDVKGFTKIFGNQSSIYYKINQVSF